RFVASFAVRPSRRWRSFSLQRPPLPLRQAYPQSARRLLDGAALGLGGAGARPGGRWTLDDLLAAPHDLGSGRGLLDDDLRLAREGETENLHPEESDPKMVVVGLPDAHRRD